MIVLRTPRPDQRDILRRWRNSPDVARQMYTDHEIGDEEHARWFARMLIDPSVRYWVVSDNGRDVGVANLYQIDALHRRCYWAFYMAQSEHRGGGIAPAVEFAVLEYAFGQMDLRKVCCEVLATNDRVLSMHSRFGFRAEGVLRAHVLKGAVPIDGHTLGLLKDEWLAKRTTWDRMFGNSVQVEII